MDSEALASKAGVFTRQTGPLAALRQVPETWNLKPCSSRCPCGKHLARVIAPQGRLAGGGVGVEAGNWGGVEVGGWVSSFRVTP